jgi:hypothetical protein
MAAMLRVALLLLCSLVALPVAAKDIEGTQVPDSVRQEGKSLHLIGGGVRSKWMFNVYVGALYAEKPTFNAANLIKSEQVKRMDLHLLRDVGKDKIIESIREGFEKNSKAQMPALQGRLDQLAAAVPDLKKGDRALAHLCPGEGSGGGWSGQGDGHPREGFRRRPVLVLAGPGSGRFGSEAEAARRLSLVFR